MCLHSGIDEIWTWDTMRVPLEYHLWPFFGKLQNSAKVHIEHNLIYNWSNQTVCHMEATCSVHVPVYWYWWGLNRGYYGGTIKVPPLNIFLKMATFSKSSIIVHIFSNNWSNQTVCYMEATCPVHVPAYWIFFENGKTWQKWCNST